MPRHIRRYGNCPYCGEYNRLTRDHVIPKNLLPEEEPLPVDFPIVYACAKCNNQKKSAYDTDLRDLLLVDVDSSQSPLAQLLYPRFIRAAGRNQSKMARAMRENSQPAELMLEPGVIAILGFTSPEAKRSSFLADDFCAVERSSGYLTAEKRFEIKPQGCGREGEPRTWP